MKRDIENKKLKSGAKINEEDDDELLDTNASSNKSGTATHSSSAISKQDFKILKVIGRGSFGKVYLV